MSPSGSSSDAITFLASSSCIGAAGSDLSLSRISLVASVHSRGVFTQMLRKPDTCMKLATAVSLILNKTVSHLADTHKFECIKQVWDQGLR
eukprot:1844715-Amphidinium_carterae.3